MYGEGGINFAYDDAGWVVDSGATFHVASRKDFFTSYTSGDFEVLTMGNDGLSKVAGTEDVFLETGNV